MFGLFNTQLSHYQSTTPGYFKKLLMIGFEPGNSVVRSDRSPQWATTPSIRYSTFFATYQTFIRMKCLPQCCLISKNPKRLSYAWKLSFASSCFANLKFKKCFWARHAITSFINLDLELLHFGLNDSQS